MRPMASISFRAVTKRYAGDVLAVNDLNLDIRDKEFVVLLGPSGCGKSTTLNMIAGLEEVTEGELWFGDEIVNTLPPHRRDVAMVFQSYALYPHKSVYENIAFGLRMRKVGFGGATGAAGRGGGAAAASFFCVIAFSTSPGREMCDAGPLLRSTPPAGSARSGRQTPVCESAGAPLPRRPASDRAGRARSTGRARSCPRREDPQSTGSGPCPPGASS